jgi:hypothetical protein
MLWLVTYLLTYRFVLSSKMSHGYGIGLQRVARSEISTFVLRYILQLSGITVFALQRQLCLHRRDDDSMSSNTVHISCMTGQDRTGCLTMQSVNVSRIILLFNNENYWNWFVYKHSVRTAQ